MKTTIHSCALFLILVSVVTAKRRAPVEVPVVRTAQAVYSAPHVRLPEFSMRNPGFVEARHPQTQKLLWRIQIHEVKYDPKWEQDVVFDAPCGPVRPRKEP